MKPLLNRDRSVTLKYCRGVPNQKNCQRLPNRGILPGEGGGGSRELRETPLESRQECHTKILLGSTKSKELSVAAKQRYIARICRNKITASEYNN